MEWFGSGRKVLFVNPQFTIAIKDMDEREGRSLLDTLFHQALILSISSQAYEHSRSGLSLSQGDRRLLHWVDAVEKGLRRSLGRYPAAENVPSGKPSEGLPFSRSQCVVMRNSHACKYRTVRPLLLIERIEKPRPVRDSRKRS
jgi:hypothetical protein